MSIRSIGLLSFGRSLSNSIKANLNIFFKLQNLFTFAYTKLYTHMGRIKKTPPQKGIVLNDFQIAALAVAFRKDTITIRRWAKINHFNLGHPAAQEIINQFEKIPNIQTIANV